MTATTKQRQPNRYGIGPVPAQTGGVVASGQTPLRGWLMGRDTSGTLKAVTADPTLRVEGLAEKDAVAGDNLNIERGAFFFQNGSGANALSAADIGNVCFAADNQTMYKTSNAGTLPIGGKVVGYDSTHGPAVLVGWQSGDIFIIEDTIAYDDTDVQAASGQTVARSLTGTLPAGAQFHGYDCDNTEVWTGGLTYELELGDGSDTDEYADDVGNIDNAVARTFGGGPAKVAAAGAIVATVTTTSTGFASAWAGSTTVRIFVKLP